MKAETASCPEPGARTRAAFLLAMWLRTARAPDALMDNVSGQDKGFVSELVYGAIRWKRKLEWIASRCSSRHIDPELLPYLLVGLYQIIVMDNVAHYAAVNETVQAVKSALPDPGARRVNFVNAVLRRALRERADILAEIARLRPGVRESHPDILVRRWLKAFGAGGTSALLSWNNTRPETVLRVLQSRVSAAEMLARFRESGIDAAPHPFDPDKFIALPRGVAVFDLPGYPDGLFAVQDPSTLVSVRLLDLHPESTVLDCCAAPGGKTAAIVERVRHPGQVTATDIGSDRLTRLEENLRRLGISGIRRFPADITRPDDIETISRLGPFDRILLDVPCTSTGVIRRRPDVRWRFSRRRLHGCAALQRRMLDAVSNLVAPGGRLVYSTCSLETEECEGMTAQWGAVNPDFRFARSERLFPPDSGTDGIYAAAFDRIAS